MRLRDLRACSGEATNVPKIHLGVFVFLLHSTHRLATGVIQSAIAQLWLADISPTCESEELASGLQVQALHGAVVQASTRIRCADEMPLSNMRLCQITGNTTAETFWNWRLGCWWARRRSCS